MCMSSKMPVAAASQQAVSQTAAAYVSPEADPNSPNSDINAVSRKKLKVNITPSPVPGSGLQIPTYGREQDSGGVRG